jgi:hypothetical protein
MGPWLTPPPHPIPIPPLPPAVLMEDVRAAVSQMGLTDAHLEAALAEYCSLGILAVNPSHTRVDIVGRA